MVFEWQVGDSTPKLGKTQESFCKVNKKNDKMIVVIILSNPYSFVSFLLVDGMEFDCIVAAAILMFLNPLFPAENPSKA